VSGFVVLLRVPCRSTVPAFPRFDMLIQHCSKVKEAFGEPLDWQRLEERRACRITKETTLGGYRNPETDWHQVIAWIGQRNDPTRGCIESLRCADQDGPSRSCHRIGVMWSPSATISP
jgi:hypothetical protein